MKRLALLTLLTLLTLSLAACQKKDATTTDTTTTTQTDATPSAADTTKTDTEANDTTKTDTAQAGTDTAASATTPAPVPSGYTLVPELSKTPLRNFSKAPDYSLDDNKDYYAVIDTDKGQIVADLLEKDVPVTVNNFVYLARNHFYDGQRFHRVIDGFMAQTGDPGSTDESKKATWGTGGPGYQFPDEIRSKLVFDQPGMLAMANSGPNTNGSQFFITFAPATFLNGGYSLFGKVVSGEDVLTKLTRTAQSGQGGETPIAGAVPDKLLSVRIATKS
ncbi:peptidylprolyl isomerase [Deinococcus irradiatisoli]|uniref:Peptidyl-prolyl cis-trans isomerase n=1 Tax=Deinococcus irradiatisoli TaxID=2202254 RepID=A0A2Z3JFZ8_9DEIO|nr:peptidylprolyl isomerase [Deinococcus irradiatisoli]AWN22401.1 peptidylprolyl isomerase [Deinococcus irradiatisoli]